MPMIVISQMSPMLPEDSVAVTVIKVGDNSNDPLCERVIGEQSWKTGMVVKSVVWRSSTTF